MDNAAYDPALDPGREENFVPRQDSVTLPVGDKAIAAEGKTEPTGPYAGMGKADLLRFSDTPYWNRVRTSCLVIFWLAWLGLLAAVVVLTIVLPRCKEAPVTQPWQRATYYQIYVRSFYDSDGDGVGDLAGVEMKLDHIDSLNVNTLVLSSFYESQVGGDFGYDIINHKAINPILGDMEAFERLLSSAHKKGMKVIVEFVPNHTGDKHPWFINSAHNNSVDNPYWNYYIWRTCDSGTPNNWLSVYGGSAWKNNSYSQRRGQCYLAQFLDSQPDLNLRSDAVQRELAGILEFWLEKGVDGFKVNSPAFLLEDSDLHDEPVIPGCVNPNKNYDCLEHIYTRNQRDVINLMLEWKEILTKWSESTGQERVLLADVHESANVTAKYYGSSSLRGVDLPSNYQLARAAPPCDGNCLRLLVDGWLDALPDGATSDWASSNQDLSRLSDIWGENSSQVINILLFTLPGPSIIFYGDEIGMANGPVNLNQDDPAGTINVSFSRDPFRTPMQWTGQPGAGFSNATAFLPINQDHVTKNVQVQQDKPSSLMENVKVLAKLFHDQRALHLGNYVHVLANTNVFSFIREFNGHTTYFVAVNVGFVESTDDYATGREDIPESGEVIISSGGQVVPRVGDRVSLSQLTLGPGEGVVVAWAYER